MGDVSPIPPTSQLSAIEEEVMVLKAEDVPVDGDEDDDDIDDTDGDDEYDEVEVTGDGDIDTSV